MSEFSSPPFIPVQHTTQKRTVSRDVLLVMETFKYWAQKITENEKPPMRIDLPEHGRGVSLRLFLDKPLPSHQKEALEGFLLGEMKKRNVSTVSVIVGKDEMKDGKREPHFFVEVTVSPKTVNFSFPPKLSAPSKSRAG